jgi:hypothetical protein
MEDQIPNKFYPELGLRTGSGGESEVGIITDFGTKGLLFRDLPVEIQGTIVDLLDPLSMWLFGLVNRNLHHLCKERMKDLKCLNGMIPPLNILTQHVLASRDLYNRLQKVEYRAKRENFGGAYAEEMKAEIVHARLVEFYLVSTQYRLEPIDLLYIVRSGNTVLLKRYLERNPDWCIPLYYTNGIVASIQSGNPAMLAMVNDILSPPEGYRPSFVTITSYFDAIAPQPHRVGYTERGHMGPLSLPKDYESIEYRGRTPQKSGMVLGDSEHMGALSLPRDHESTEYRRGTPQTCDIPHVGQTSGFHRCFARKFVHLTEEELDLLELAIHTNTSLSQHFVYWKLQDKIDRGTYRSFTRDDLNKYYSIVDDDAMCGLVENLLVYAAYWAQERFRMDAMQWVLSLYTDELFVDNELLWECACSTGNADILRAVAESEISTKGDLIEYLRQLWMFGEVRTYDRNADVVSYVRSLCSDIEYKRGPASETDAASMFPFHMDIYRGLPRNGDVVRRRLDSGAKSHPKTKLNTGDNSLKTQSENTKDKHQYNRAIECCNTCQVLRGDQLTYADPRFKVEFVLDQVGKTKRLNGTENDKMEEEDDDYDYDYEEELEGSNRIDAREELMALARKGCSAELMREAIRRVNRCGGIFKEDIAQIAGMMLLFSRGDLLDVFTQRDTFPGKEQWYEIVEYADYLFTMALYSGNWEMVRKVALIYLTFCKQITIPTHAVVTNTAWLADRVANGFDGKPECIILTTKGDGSCELKIVDNTRKLRTKDNRDLARERKKH